jgi:hypothetical protein
MSEVHYGRGYGDNNPPKQDCEEGLNCTKDNYPLAVPNKPALPASQNDLQYSLDWQKTLTTSDEPVINHIPSSLDHNPTNSIAIDTNNNSSVSWTSNPMTLKKFPITAPSYLNEEQTLAFNIVVQHLMEHLQGRNPPQLLMTIHRQGGTGKTRLLQVITSLFSELGCTDLFAKTAFTGVAACQIGGKTLHSWATIPAGKGTPRSDTWIHHPSRETAKKQVANM